MKILRYLPKNYLSYGFGKLAGMPLPPPLNSAVIKWFAATYNINLAEAEQEISQYRSLGDFFVRALKPGSRPIGEGLVHPCDAAITEFGKVENQTLIQAKGINYKLIDLLKSQDLAGQLEGGTFVTYYLCPADYHRVHAPADMLVHACTHVPGQLWPVNSWSVTNISNLFPRNERLVAHLEINKRPAALVMVGATNVGKMTVEFDKTLVTNTLRSRLVNREYRPPILMKAGDPFGAFHMGSTVVMIYAPGVVSVAQIRAGHVLMGQKL